MPTYNALEELMLYNSCPLHPHSYSKRSGSLRHASMAHCQYGHNARPHTTPGRITQDNDVHAQSFLHKTPKRGSIGNYVHMGWGPTQRPSIQRPRPSMQKSVVSRCSRQEDRHPTNPTLLQYAAQHPGTDVGRGCLHAQKQQSATITSRTGEISKLSARFSLHFWGHRPSSRIPAEAAQFTYTMITAWARADDPGSFAGPGPTRLHPRYMPRQGPAGP
ncbi:uncharacterized protein K452DRAFT_355831 [Aplosporella prunicola CBS 121167]|uniref:Uncharacterized protein n=1 Tax=Aplosporella prunicola CBS 121167 TaxID=1176127 RepID=A0A6A6BRZ1_9PEZI|nr:uncharacterized protein K452DRAFT_355831 [Aplosporella prunicola CBS 121167]KAF2145351.1 hypothetical protein K452DRAFT_355831 [Aplosporella prunicola CBS 121167]